MKRILGIIFFILCFLSVGFSQIETINNGETGLSVRNKLNNNFSYLYSIVDTAQELTARTIYVSPSNHPTRPGNDITGDGLTNTTAFATIYRALDDIKLFLLNNLTITIQCDSGQVTIDDKTIGYYNYLNLLGFKNIKIQGSTQNVYTSVTGSNDANDLFNFNCTSHTFTPNELVGLFGTTGTKYYPIESNTSTVISRSGAGTTMPTIIRLNTTLYFTSRFNSFNSDYFGTQYGLTINLCKITMTTTGNKIFSGVGFTNCHFTFPASANYLQVLDRGISIDASYITSASSSSAIIINGYLSLTNSVLTSTLSKTANGLSVGPHGVGKNILFSVYSNIYANFLIGYLFRTNCSWQVPTSATYPIKFKNCTNILGKSSSTANTLEIYYRFGELYVETCDYMALNNDGPLRIDIKTVHGSFSSSYINPASLSTSFINPEIGQIINIPNTYPEYQQNQTVTLADNSTDSISIADITYNRTIELKCEIKRGSDYQTKTIKILNGDATFTMIQLPDSIQTNDIGVRFDGVYQSGTSNILKLKWHTTSTGTAGTLTYDAYRRNY